jgi:GT2 family glycosyltransferase
MDKPLVSVLIPCFNAARYIGETLRSVRAQTYPNIETIVVDDGSTDASAAVVREFPDVILHQQPNAGVTAARNAAFARSRGEFIQYLDADDLLAPDKIELQMGRLRDRPLCVATAEWGRFYSDPAETQFKPDDTWADHDPRGWLALSGRNGLGMMFPGLWLIPRGVAVAAGPWNETLGRALGEDAEYFTRIVLKAQNIFFCKGAKVYYRSGIGGASSKKTAAAWRSQAVVIDLCEKHVLAAENSERMRAGFAKSWQGLAHACYPYDRELANSALARARALSPVVIRPTGGRAFNIISAVAGWRIARQLQVYSGRN